MPFGFSAGPVQIATCNFPPRSCDLFTLPPHAPCRLQRFLCRNFLFQPPLPPHAPCRLQRVISRRAPATFSLCLHTLRADCNRRDVAFTIRNPPLPPHAPCRLQLSRRRGVLTPTCFASTRSVQIATVRQRHPRAGKHLCLHTLRTDCNVQSWYWQLRRWTLPPHAPCRLQHINQIKM